ncbi:MAG: diaminopimelate dehydrogenase [Alphaproteobacteria bacterium]|nr:diaminopimelate dehydrogenase [Alphaproteobacteria bacterium]
MQKISVAIVGWGNVGRGCKRAIAECSDLVLAGVVRRASSLKYEDPDLENTVVVSDIRELENVDVAILCIPSREVPERVKQYHELGISTIDSYDEHLNIASVRRDLDISAKSKKVVSIIGAGWDPGTDSAIRAIMKLVSITGYGTTTFGGENGGRSMGHTVQVKQIEGVKDAVALTLANGRGKQKRKVYLELEKGADLAVVEKAILSDAYFKNDPTEVIEVKNINKYNTLNHSVCLERTGMQVNQKYEAEGVNPEFTANIMVSCARACMKAYLDEDYGAYTFIERPLIDYLPGVTIDEKLEIY